MYNVKFTVPKHNNAGIYYDEKVFSQIEYNLLKIAGGLSKYDMEGKWIDNGRQFEDQNVLYELVVDDLSKVNQLKELVTGLKSELHQLSMFFAVSQVEVSFL